MHDKTNKFVDKLKIPFFIDFIQTSVKMQAESIGVGKNYIENCRMRLFLLTKLDEAAYIMEKHMESRGDPNISQMMAISYISTAWTSFIIKAKSLDNRRDKEARKIMKTIVKNYCNVMKKIIDQSKTYGSTYDKLGGFDNTVKRWNLENEDNSNRNDNR